MSHSHLTCFSPQRTSGIAEHRLVYQAQGFERQQTRFDDLKEDYTDKNIQDFLTAEKTLQDPNSTAQQRAKAHEDFLKLRKKEEVREFYFQRKKILEKTTKRLFRLAENVEKKEQKEMNPQLKSAFESMSLAQISENYEYLEGMDAVSHALVGELGFNAGDIPYVLAELSTRGKKIDVGDLLSVLRDRQSSIFDEILEQMWDGETTNYLDSQFFRGKLDAVLDAIVKLQMTDYVRNRIEDPENELKGDGSLDAHINVFANFRKEGESDRTLDEGYARRKKGFWKRLFRKNTNESPELSRKELAQGVQIDANALELRGYTEQVLAEDLRHACEVFGITEPADFQAMLEYFRDLWNTEGQDMLKGKDIDALVARHNGQAYAGILYVHEKSGGRPLAENFELQLRFSQKSALSVLGTTSIDFSPADIFSPSEIWNALSSPHITPERLFGDKHKDIDALVAQLDYDSDKEKIEKLNQVKNKLSTMQSNFQDTLNDISEFVGQKGYTIDRSLVESQMMVHLFAALGSQEGTAQGWDEMMALGGAVYLDRNQRTALIVGGLVNGEGSTGGMVGVNRTFYIATLGKQGKWEIQANVAAGAVVGSDLDAGGTVGVGVDVSRALGEASQISLGLGLTPKGVGIEAGFGVVPERQILNKTIAKINSQIQGYARAEYTNGAIKITITDIDALLNHSMFAEQDHLSEVDKVNLFLRAKVDAVVLQSFREASPRFVSGVRIGGISEVFRKMIGSGSPALTALALLQFSWKGRTYFHEVNFAREYATAQDRLRDQVRIAEKVAGESAGTKTTTESASFASLRQSFADAGIDAPITFVKKGNEQKLKIDLSDTHIDTQILLGSGIEYASDGTALYLPADITDYRIAKSLLLMPSETTRTLVIYRADKNATAESARKYALKTKNGINLDRDEHNEIRLGYMNTERKHENFSEWKNAEPKTTETKYDYFTLELTGISEDTKLGKIYGSAKELAQYVVKNQNYILQKVKKYDAFDFQIIDALIQHGVLEDESQSQQYKNLSKEQQYLFAKSFYAEVFLYTVQKLENRNEQGITRRVETAKEHDFPQELSVSEETVQQILEMQNADFEESLHALPAGATAFMFATRGESDPSTVPLAVLQENFRLAGQTELIDSEKPVLFEQPAVRDDLQARFTALRDMVEKQHNVTVQSVSLGSTEIEGNNWENHIDAIVEGLEDGNCEVRFQLSDRRSITITPKLTAWKGLAVNGLGDENKPTCYNPTYAYTLEMKGVDTTLPPTVDYSSSGVQTATTAGSLDVAKNVYTASFLGALRRDKVGVNEGGEGTGVTEDEPGGEGTGVTEDEPGGEGTGVTEHEP